MSISIRSCVQNQIQSLLSVRVTEYGARCRVVLLVKCKRDRWLSFETSCDVTPLCNRLKVACILARFYDAIAADNLVALFTIRQLIYFLWLPTAFSSHTPFVNCTKAVWSYVVWLKTSPMICVICTLTWEVIHTYIHPCAITKYVYFSLCATYLVPTVNSEVISKSSKL